MATASVMRSAAFGSSARLQGASRAPVRATVAPLVARAPTVQVSAMAKAGDKKAAKKRTPAPVKRAMLAKERRLYNKARKSACATRIKKVLKAATTLMSSPPSSEADVKPLEKLIAEAYQEVDKAVKNGVLHANNAARKKSRVARYKRMVLMSAGLFVPPQEHPDYNRYQKMQAKKAAQTA